MNKIKVNKNADMDIERIINVNILQYLIILSLAAILCFIYEGNVNNVNTVWELGDEAGYLSNAAYFAGYDWSDVAASLPYYGYGYSLLLIPLFYICNEGVELIKGAIVLNGILVLITYFMQIAVMKNVCRNCRIVILALFAFVSNLYPYIMTNANKVLCEVFLVFWVWLIAGVIVIAIRYNNIFTYSLLGMVTAFIFFIHTRAIVVVATVCLVAMVSCYKGNTSIKNLMAYFVGLIIVFGLLYFVKINIINSSMQMFSGDDRQNTNLITPQFIILRLKWITMPENIGNYIVCLFGKILYLMSSTAVMFAYGIRFLFVKIKNTMLKKSESEIDFYIMLYFMLVVILMILACVFSGAGMEDNYTYTFYGRYYEYVIEPIIIIGLYSCYTENYKNKEIIIIALLCVISGIITKYGINYLNSNEIHIDTARVAGFTYGITQNNNYISLIMFLTMICIVLVALYKCLMVNNKTRIIIPLIVLLWLLMNDEGVIDKINQVSNDAKGDINVAEYIMDNVEEDYFHFVDGNFKYSGYYSRLQVLVKNKTLKVISEDDLNVYDKQIVITYLSTDLGKALEEEGKMIVRGSVFGIYGWE